MDKSTFSDRESHLCKIFKSFKSIISIKYLPLLILENSILGSLYDFLLNSRIYISVNCTAQLLHKNKNAPNIPLPAKSKESQRIAGKKEKKTSNEKKTAPF